MQEADRRRKSVTLARFFHLTYPEQQFLFIPYLPRSVFLHQGGKKLGNMGWM